MLVVGAYYDGLYKAVLVLHILCAIVGFGGVMLNALYGREVQRRGGAEGAAVFDVNFAVTKIAQYVIYGVFVFGFALVLLSDDAIGFDETWVWLAMLLFVVALGISHGLLTPALKRMRVLMGELAAGQLPATAAGAAPSPPPQATEMAALGKRVGATGATLNVIVVVMLTLMIWKPGA